MQTISEEIFKEQTSPCYAIFPDGTIICVFHIRRFAFIIIAYILIDCSSSIHVVFSIGELLKIVE